jgi:NitT/TauT family transport system substrate-binding protein
MTRLVTVLLVVMAGCRGERGAEPARLRLGYFPTVTHAVALVANERGAFARALAPVTVEARAFGSGPEAMEALFAGALDAAYVGPMPAVNAYLRTKGQAIRIVAGAAHGGAAFVVAKDSGITGPESLHKRKLATPQLGNSQDVALRAWLAAHGLRSTDRGGDVQVMPVSNPDILSLMRSGRLDGAWVVEPWVSRLVHETGARVLVDERTLWPDGRYPTAVLVVTRKLLEQHPDRVRKLVEAHAETVAWIQAHPDEARALAAQAIKTHAHKALPEAVMRDAFARVTVTSDPALETLAKVAAQGRALGYLPREGDPRDAVDMTYVNQVEKHD